MGFLHCIREFNTSFGIEESYVPLTYDLKYTVATCNDLQSLVTCLDCRGIVVQHAVMQACLKVMSCCAKY